MRAEYLRFQIRTVSGIYKLSNMFPLIGGPITTLTISSRGFESYETREEIDVPSPLLPEPFVYTPPSSEEIKTGSDRK
jgi:hypothetical protein